MKHKSIGFFEQHLEKIVAGVFAVVLLVVLSAQFLMPGPTVKVGTKEVPLNNAAGAVADLAQSVQSKINSPPTLETPAEDPTADLAAFLKGYSSPVAPARELALGLGRGLAVPGGAADASAASRGGAGGQQAFAPLVIAGTGKPTAATYMSSVDVRVENDPSVLAVLPKTAPHDIPSVTVEAVFNGRALAMQLERDPDGEGPLRAMPRFWWDGDRLQVVHVELERRRRAADGGWGEPERVPAMPFRYGALMAEIIEDEIGGAAELESIAKQAADEADLVLRPPFYATLAGEPWLPPSDRASAEALVGSSDIPSLQRKLAGLDRQIDDLARRLGDARAGGPGGEAGRPGQRPGSGGGRGGEGGGGKRGNQPEPSSPASPQQQQQQVRALEQRLQRTLNDREEIAFQLRGQGLDVPERALPGREGGFAPPGERRPAPPPPPPGGGGVQTLLTSPEIRLWSHDVAVEHGATYQYRTVLVFNNPMYGKYADLGPDQQDWAKPAFVRSQPSEWSDSVRTDDRNYYFITSATEANQLARAASARAELFTFSWGYWRRQDVQVEPGDRLQAVVKVPDWSKILTDAVDPNAPQPGGPAPGAPGRRPGPAERDGAESGQPGRDPNDPAPAPPTISVPVLIDATVLAVAAQPAMSGASGGQPPAQVFMRSGSGMVEVRLPSADRENQHYARLKSSADRGELDLKPKAPSVPGPGQPGQPDRPSEPPPDSGGGPGGGGSGGG